MSEDTSRRVRYWRPKRVVSAARAEAQIAVEELIGLYLVDMHRAFGFQCLVFVEEPISLGQDPASVREAAIHLAGRWRMTDGAGFTLCSGHFGPKNARRDAHANSFYSRLEEDPYRVEWAKVAVNGTLTVGFNDGLILKKPSRPKFQRFHEEWRYMPLDQERPHMVLDWHGLAWSP